jgi:hypothetical protein
MKMLRLFTVITALGLVSGCASTGTIGNKKLEAADLAQLESLAGDVAPLLQTAALASGNPSAAKAAGLLAKFSPASAKPGEAVPAGYVVKWDSFLDGKQIDETKIVRKPRLVAVGETAVLKEQVPGEAVVETNGTAQTLQDAVRGL